MKAMELKTAVPGPLLIAAGHPQPQPGEGEVLICVHASGVTPMEVIWCPTEN